MNRVTEVVLCAVVGFALIGPGSAAGQSAGAWSRTQAIVASFNKSKHTVKEKYGLRMEKFKEIRSEAEIKPNVRDYSGAYEVQGMGYRLDLRVVDNRTIAATGYEPADVSGRTTRTFGLRNARIDGALLTATKLYANGATEPFEGVFINRTSFDSPRGTGTATFGLGVRLASVRVANGLYLDKLFYERTQ